MNRSLFRGSLGLMLALMLVLSALPLSALAAASENSEFTLIELKGTDVTLDQTAFEYTGREIRPNVTVRVEDRLLTLDKDYTLRFENNVEVGTAKVIVSGIATAAPSYGYTGTVEIPFYINEKAPEFTLVELKGTDVTINGTEFVYSGQPIEPAVTVTIDGKTLTPGQDYAVEYVNNLVPGTGTVIVRGIATASETVGYTGEVRIDFTIRPMTEEEYPLTEIKAGDVTVDGKEFPYTGEAIEPKITVTVDGEVLTAGRDYSLRYENNVEVGTGKAIVTGLATATEFGGYTGTVEVKFTIVSAETEPPKEEAPVITEIKGTDVTIEGTRFPYTGKAIEPKVTVSVGGKVLTAGIDYSLTYENNTQVGSAAAIVRGLSNDKGGYSGEVKINFSIVEVPAAPSYKVTKGGSAVWYQKSTANLSFTADGPFADFIGVTIGGKTVAKENYTVKEASGNDGGTIVTLKADFLSKLSLNKYAISLHFEDGEATTTFTVAAETSDNPKTGDEFPLHGLMAVMFVSLTGLIGFGYAYFKKIRK